jgi:hypothetical protein
MLLRRETLDRIATGEITCVFRRWERPTVKTGGTLKTAAGVLRIDEIAETTFAAIRAGDIRAAGYASKAILLAELAQRPDGKVYRIRLHREGDDPRLALRERSRLSAGELRDLLARLARFDAASPHGAWTRRVLEEIGRQPQVPAGTLAASLELPKDWLKVSVRKLKNLGLTISCDPGYEVSPRGRSALRALARQ